MSAVKTFAEARAIAEKHYADTFEGGVASRSVGYEDADAYVIELGDARWIIAGQDRYEDRSGVAYSVSKSDGAVVELPMYVKSVRDRVFAMTEIS